MLADVNLHATDQRAEYERWSSALLDVLDHRDDALPSRSFLWGAGHRRSLKERSIGPACRPQGSPSFAVWPPRLLVGFRLLQKPIDERADRNSAGRFRASHNVVSELARPRTVQCYDQSP